MSIQAAVKRLNKYPQFGTVKVLDLSINDHGLPDVQPGDVAIYADFMDDDCPSKDVVNELSAWYYDELPREINQLMAGLGFKHIYEDDGSGGGLYYGTTQYRKTR